MATINKLDHAYDWHHIVWSGPQASAPETVWEQVEQRLHRVRAAQELPSVEIVRAPEVPQTHPISGKSRQVWSEARNDAATRGIGEPITYYPKGTERARYTQQHMPALLGSGSRIVATGRRAATYAR